MGRKKMLSSQKIGMSKKWLSIVLVVGVVLIGGYVTFENNTQEVVDEHELSKEELLAIYDEIEIETIGTIVITDEQVEQRMEAELRKIDGTELTDAIVQQISDQSNTVEQYQTEIKKILEEEAYVQAEEVQKDQIWSKIVAETEVDTTGETEFDTYVTAQKKEYQKLAEAEGMSFATYLEEVMGMSEELLEIKLEQIALDYYKETLVKEKIMEVMEFEYTEEELEVEYQRMSEIYGYQSVDVMKEQVAVEELKEMAETNLLKQDLIQLVMSA